MSFYDSVVSPQGIPSRSSLPVPPQVLHYDYSLILLYYSLSCAINCSTLLPPITAVPSFSPIRLLRCGVPAFLKVANWALIRMARSSIHINNLAKGSLADSSISSISQYSTGNAGTPFICSSELYWWGLEKTMSSLKSSNG